MTLKKVFPFILITAVILGIFFGPLNAKPIYAQVVGSGLSAARGAISIIQWYKGTETGSDSWVTGLASDVVYYIIWTPASWFMGLGGWVMNKGISISITGSTFSTMATGKNSAVTVGWGVARDIVNLFLIFILLYIAIATILQVSGYGAKELLVTLIIIAFLVNFSLVITKLIIDASNVLTMGFYNAFTTKDSSGVTNISKAFENAFDIDKLANEKDIEAISDSLTRFLALLFSSALMLIAGFIFLVFGILFVIRMVVLLILMVFSPLAFAAHILPSTQQHAKKWWSTLFDQAFFAPAAMFMLYWAAKIAQSDVIKTALGIQATGGPGIGDMIQAGSAPGGKANDLFAFTLQFVIIAIILIASLIIAKQMGAIGAQTAIAGGKKMSKKLQGYAGRISTRTGARMIRPVAESKAMQRVAAWSPKYGGAALRTLQAGAKAGGLDEIIKRRATLGMSLAPQQRADYIAKADERTRQEMWKQMPAKDRAVMMMLRPSGKPVYDRMSDKLPAEEKEKTEKAYKEAERKVLVDTLSEIKTPLADFTKNLKLFKPDEVKDLKSQVITDPVLGLDKLDAMVDNLTIAHVQKIIDRGDEVTKSFFDALATLGGSIDDIAKNVESRNSSMAAAVRGNPIVKAELQSRGISP